MAKPAVSETIGVALAFHRRSLGETRNVLIEFYFVFQTKWTIDRHAMQTQGVSHETEGITDNYGRKQIPFSTLHLSS